jgi:RimJ/RimL family protein N-acetyltransferase
MPSALMSIRAIEGSLALLDRLGFAEVRRAERTWLVGDEWCDSVLPGAAAT